MSPLGGPGAPRDFGGLLAARLGRRYAAGPGAADAVRVAADLRSRGLLVAVERVAHPPRSRADAEAAAADLLAVLDAAGPSGLASDAGVEVLVGVRSVGAGNDVDGGVDGSSEGGDGEGAARLERLAAAAAAAGTRLTVRPSTEAEAGAALAAAARLRAAHPWTGVEVWAALRRTEGDLTALLGGGAGAPRVLLRTAPEGARTASGGLTGADAERAYVRYAKRLLRTAPKPVLAVPDATLAAVVQSLAEQAGPLAAESWELLVDMGRRTEDAHRLAALGHRVRVRVPFGPRWKAEGVRGLASRAPLPRRAGRRA